MLECSIISHLISSVFNYDITTGVTKVLEYYIEYNVLLLQIKPCHCGACLRPEGPRILPRGTLLLEQNYLTPLKYKEYLTYDKSI
jgi:hypothetical protein